MKTCVLNLTDSLQSISWSLESPRNQDAAVPCVLFDVPVSDLFTVVYYLFEAFVNTDSELMIAVTMT